MPKGNILSPWIVSLQFLTLSNILFDLKVSLQKFINEYFKIPTTKKPNEELIFQNIKFANQIYNRRFLKLIIFKKNPHLLYDTFCKKKKI